MTNAGLPQGFWLPGQERLDTPVFIAGQWVPYSPTQYAALLNALSDPFTAYLRADGTRSLTGNMSASAGVTFDGVDVGAHTHTGAGSNGPQVDHASLSNVTANQHHNQSHGASDHTDRTRYLYFAAADFTAATGAGDPALSQVAVDSSNVQVNAFVFPTTADKGIERTVHMPSDWNAGAVSVDFYWAPSNTNTNTAVWIVAFTTYTAGDLVDKAIVSNPSATVTPSGTAKALHVSQITASTTPATSIFKFVAYRFTASASDTFTGDMWFLGARISYTADM